MVIRFGLKNPIVILIDFSKTFKVFIWIIKDFLIKSNAKFANLFLLKSSTFEEVDKLYIVI